MKIARECVRCGSAFSVQESQLSHGRGRCCSRNCAAALASVNRDSAGDKNPNWKGGSIAATDPDIARKRRHKENYKRKHPERNAAHVAVRDALRTGVLVKGPCEVCGDHKVEGHHDDYLLPLDVRWLCRRHHLDVHSLSSAGPSPLKRF